MSEFKRSTRVAVLLRHELSEIISQKSKDPLIGMVTITYIKLTDDLKSARVYIRILGNEESRERGLRGLSRACKWIRSELGHRMDLKYVPKLLFVYDEAADRVRAIETLLEKINRESNESPAGDPTIIDF